MLVIVDSSSCELTNFVPQKCELISDQERLKTWPTVCLFILICLFLSLLPATTFSQQYNLSHVCTFFSSVLLIWCFAICSSTAPPTLLNLALSLSSLSLPLSLPPVS